MRTAVNYIEHILIVTKTTSTKNRADERMISSLKSASKSCIEVTLCRPQCTALNTRRCRKHAWTTHRYTQTHNTRLHQHAYFRLLTGITKQKTCNNVVIVEFDWCNITRLTWRCVKLYKHFILFWRVSFWNNVGLTDFRNVSVCRIEMNISRFCWCRLV